MLTICAQEAWPHVLSLLREKVQSSQSKLPVLVHFSTSIGWKTDFILEITSDDLAAAWIQVVGTWYVASLSVETSVLRRFSLREHWCADILAERRCLVGLGSTGIPALLIAYSSILLLVPT